MLTNVGDRLGAVERTMSSPRKKTFQVHRKRGIITKTHCLKSSQECTPNCPNPQIHKSHMKNDTHDTRTHIQIHTGGNKGLIMQYKTCPTKRDEREIDCVGLSVMGEYLTIPPGDGGYSAAL